MQWHGLKHMLAGLHVASKNECVNETKCVCVCGFVCTKD